MSDHPLHRQVNIAENGWATFPNLINRGSLSGADYIVIDQSNDDAYDTPEVEAWLRIMQAAGQKVVYIINPYWTTTDDGDVDTPVNATAIEQVRTLLTNYGITPIDGWALTQAHVTGGGHITDWFADVGHWNATGHAMIAALITPKLQVGGTITLPGSRTYASSEDWEVTPINKNGTVYDSKTGSWTENGASITSSEVGATITFSGTFRKFGIYNAAGSYPSLTFQVDEESPVSYPLGANGLDLLASPAAHTVVLTVETEITIDKFWAI